MNAGDWAARFVLAGVRFYQAALRPLNPWACKFHPSCSDYSVEAITRHGVIRGSVKSMARILRCSPFSKGGVDMP